MFLNIFGFAEPLSCKQQIVWRDSVYKICSPDADVPHYEKWKDDYALEAYDAYWLVRHFSMDSAWIAMAAAEAKELYGY